MSICFLFVLFWGPREVLWKAEQGGGLSGEAAGPAFQIPLRHLDIKFEAVVFTHRVAVNPNWSLVPC